MSKALCTLALLTSALTLTLTAHADTIDDFVLTGQGNTITFSFPATPSNASPVYIMRGPETAGFLIPDSIIVNGQTTPAFFQFTNGFAPGSSGFILNTPGNSEFFQGPILYSGSSITPTFLTGTFTFNLFVSTFPPEVPYILTITPEPATATPEPSTLALLTTGTFGLIAFAARRKESRHFFD
jgi:PEP-CTERM motif